MSMIENEQNHQFCYFEVRNPQSLVTESSLMFMSVVLFAFAIKKYRDIWRLARINRNQKVNITYIGILAWWITYNVKAAYGITLYVIYSSKEESFTEELSFLSKFYFSLDWVNAFILQSLLLFVPYHLMKQISEAIAAIQGNSDSDYGSGIGYELIRNEGSKYDGIEPSLYPKIGLYLKARVFCVVPIIVFLVIHSFEVVSLMSKIMLSVLVADCVIIIAILSLGLYSLKRNQVLRTHLDHEEAQLLFVRYMVMVVCTVIRLLYDAFYLVYGAAEKLTQDDCSLNKSVIWLLIAMMVGSAVLAHYLPIFIILRIYTVEEKPEDITKSLIIAGEREED